MRNKGIKILLTRYLTSLKMGLREFIRYRTLMVGYGKMMSELREHLGPGLAVERFNLGRGHSVKFLVSTIDEKVQDAHRDRKKYLVMAASYYVEYVFRRNHPGTYVHFKEKFQREYGILCELSEHGLAPSGCLLTDKYYVREFVKGMALSDLLERDVGVNGFEAKVCVMRSLEYLHKIHSLGIIHKDPMPSNIIIPNEGGIKFIDFEVFERMAGKTEDMAKAFDFYRLLNEAMSVYRGNRVDLCKEGIKIVRELASPQVFKEFLRLLIDKEELTDVVRMSQTSHD
jgi:serine/threonine protein kinase